MKRPLRQRLFRLGAAGVLFCGAPAISMAAKVAVISAADAAALSEAVLIDARPAADYSAGHAAGAIHMDWMDWTVEKPGLWSRLRGGAARWGLVLDDVAALEPRLSSLGLRNASTIVVMGSPAGWGEEGRVAWNLLYWGAEDVRLLNGGYPAWKAAGLPQSIEPPVSRPPGAFQVRLDATRRMRRDDVLRAVQAGERLIDTRTPEEHAGQTFWGQARGGRLPNAILLPARSLYGRDGGYIARDVLEQLWRPEGPRPAAYCAAGVRSALFAVLYEARTGVSVSNYDGSMWEWTADKGLPLDSGR